MVKQKLTNLIEAKNYTSNLTVPSDLRIRFILIYDIRETMWWSLFLPGF